MADSVSPYAGLTADELLALSERTDDMLPEDQEALWVEIRRRGLEGKALEAYEKAGQRRKAPPDPLEKLEAIAKPV